MTGSQDSAVAAALQEAKVPFKPKVSTVSKDSPADGKLKPGDIVLQVDGATAAQVPQVGELVRKHKVGEDVSFLISRGGKQETVVVKTAATPGDADPPDGRHHDRRRLAGQGDVNLGQDIGGPSAGTAFALAIYDKLTAGALLDGKHVAGTGTIDALGQVGAIGGIQQKIAGAKDDGATVFLVPEPNCEAALHAGVDGIQLVKISTLHEAIDALKALASWNWRRPGMYEVGLTALPPQRRCSQAVIEIERHVSSAGWDQPAQLFALVPTEELLAAEPQLAAQLDADDASQPLTPVAQGELPGGMDDEHLADALARIEWPDGVSGCASGGRARSCCRRRSSPAWPMPSPTPSWPGWRAAIRAGTKYGWWPRYCVTGDRFGAVRLRTHDEDSAVLTGVDLVPTLCQVLSLTFEPYRPTGR